MKSLYLVLVIAAVAAGGALALFSPPIESVSPSNLPVYGPVPELAGIAGWINTEPFTLDSLKGKVVLVDFWTYSCINCIRTLPTLKAWDDKYRDKGLVIVGVHTPEFEFEKKYQNVQTFVQENNIQYAVALDNDYQTWRAFKNNYWPRKYLVDKEGNIRYDHIGEGGYEETEAVIQELLGTHMPATAPLGEQVTGPVGTPELYLGYQFIRAPLGNPESLRPGEVTVYTEEQSLLPNTVYLTGSWLSLADAVEARENAGLQLLYTAKNVNIVAGGEGTVQVWVDDVQLDSVTIDNQQLYTVVAGQTYGTHVVRLEFSKNVQLYTFTFG